jgi:hypothetical protein
MGGAAGSSWTLNLLRRFLFPFLLFLGAKFTHPFRRHESLRQEQRRSSQTQRPVSTQGKTLRVRRRDSVNRALRRLWQHCVSEVSSIASIFAAI